MITLKDGPEDFHERTRKYWNSRNAEFAQTVKYWYQHPQALKYYRDLIDLRDDDLAVKPNNVYLRSRMPGHIFNRAISIGCGAGFKEMRLITDGIVNSFDLFELSDKTIEIGVKQSENLDISSKARFHKMDLLSENRADSLFGRYDLVHWDNSLHHMYDTAKAIEISSKLLNSGGVLLIDDYVGPTYFDFSKDKYAIADSVRSILPQKYLKNNTADAEKYPILPNSPRIAKEAFLRTDPSEMADSSNILPAIISTLPNADIIRTGGIVYFLALRPLFGNFNPEDPTDVSFLNVLLQLDRELTQQYPDSTCHAVICWQKP